MPRGRTACSASFPGHRPFVLPTYQSQVRGETFLETVLELTPPIVWLCSARILVHCSSCWRTSQQKLSWNNEPGADYSDFDKLGNLIEAASPCIGRTGSRVSAWEIWRGQAKDVPPGHASILLKTTVHTKLVQTGNQNRQIQTFLRSARDARVLGVSWPRWCGLKNASLGGGQLARTAYMGPEPCDATFPRGVAFARIGSNA